MKRSLSACALMWSTESLTRCSTCGVCAEGPVSCCPSTHVVFCIGRGSGGHFGLPSPRPSANAPLAIYCGGHRMLCNL